MSNIAMQGGATGTGTVTLLAPVTNTNRTINLPDSNGTVLTTATAGVPVNGPAFSYYQSSAQTLSSGTTTKITFTSSDFDTSGGMFASSRFTPTVSGYYAVSTGVQVNTTATGISLEVWKNGAIFKRLSNTVASNGVASSSCLVYCNGSTDYVEIYANFTLGQALSTGSPYTYFQAAMVRSAT